ncbi:MAG: hypothetical protein ACUVTQ_02555 [Desulfotomaculales bacterium]
MAKVGRNDPCPCEAGKVQEVLPRAAADEAVDLQGSARPFHRFNWCQDLEMELGNAGVKDPAFHEKRIAYCREFCALFPESDESIIENMKRAVAESLFALGRIEEGERAFQDLVREFPRSAWAYIGWADMYWLCEESKAPRDYDRAEKLYRLALGRDVEDKEEVLERLRMLEEERRKVGA